jgi:plasmid stabilization system protein ParE
MGSIVEEFQNSEILQIVVGRHRVIYQYQANTILILTIFHGSRLLRKSDLGSE